MLRASTLGILLRYHTGPVKLSEAIRVSMEADAVSPILVEGHMQALDRRIPIVLQVTLRVEQLLYGLK